MKNPKVLTFTINYNGKEDTAKLIKSIKNSNYKNLDILIVDNSRTEENVNYLKKKFPKLKVIENKKNVGCSLANNQAIEYAVKNKFDYIYILNNDTILDKNCIPELVKTMQSDPKIAVVGSKIYNLVGNKRYLQTITRKINIKKGSLKIDIGECEDLGQFNEQKEVEYSWGGTILINLKAIKEVGMFDLDYFVYYESQDFQYRLRKAGYKVMYEPKAIIWHKGSSSLPNSRVFYYYSIRNRIMFVKKHATKFDKFCFTLYYSFLAQPSLLLKLLVRWDFKGVYASFQGMFDAITNNYGMKQF